MKELFAYIFSLNLKALFFKPSTNSYIQVFRYLFVGGVAFVVDGGSLWLFESLLNFHYLIATAIAFIFGLITNFCLAKTFVFNAEKAKFNVVTEFISYGLIGLVGLLLTMGLMFIGVDIFSLPVMITKCFAVIIVLFWNYGARKIIIYKDGEKNE